jgi:hypothetical protein
VIANDMPANDTILYSRDEGSHSGLGIKINKGEKCRGQARSKVAGMAMTRASPGGKRCIVMVQVVGGVHAGTG